jgi:1,2-diacylglycerol 3-beta-galactosyltransferase
MIPQTNRKKKINFLFSDTGGGHRSSAEAIIEALELEYPGVFDTRMIDIFRDYAPHPFRDVSKLYPHMTRSPLVWEAGYRISDGRRKAQLLNQITWPYIRQAAMRLVAQNPCDLFVSVHPFANRAFINITSKRDIPFATVVTDMVSAHSFWFDPRADLVIVPTDDARKVGIENGMPRSRITVAGQPVAERFRNPHPDKKALKLSLGWESNLPVVLMAGGGDGLGPLERIAHALDEAKLPAHLAIITGRNQALRRKLENRIWQIPVSIYGFVRDMPDMMGASDILVTKAGPGTISEAFIAGLPIILYSRLPGQEDGNVPYVVENKAGVWAPEASQAVEAVQMWLNDPSALAQAAAASKRLARPDATRIIARLLTQQFFAPVVNTPFSETGLGKTTIPALFPAGKHSNP